MRSKSLLFLISLILFIAPAIYSQPLFSTYYSPLSGQPTSLLFLEIDFSSARLQGLGYQLYPVIQDTITNLFRNPVTIYNIENRKIYLQVENAIGRYRTSAGPTYSTSQFNYNLFKVDIPYLSFGFWSAKSFLFNRPVGIFISGVHHRNFDNNNRYEPTTSMLANNNYLEYTRKYNYETKIDEIFSRLWLGLVNNSKFSLALSYQYTYHDYPNFTILSENYTRIMDMYFSQQHEIFNREDHPYRLKYHRIILGGKTYYKKWKIESDIQYLNFNEKTKQERKNTEISKTYLTSNPDSLSNMHSYKFELKKDFNPISSFGALNIQANKNNWILFLSVLYGQVTMDDHDQSCVNQFLTDNQDTLAKDIGKFSSKFSDAGDLIRTKLGIGKQYQFKRILDIYTALIFDLSRFSITGNIPAHDYYYIMEYQSQPMITDTTSSNKITYSSTDYRIYLPLGWEINYKNFMVRLGLTWYYYSESFERSLKSYKSTYIEKRRSEFSDIYRQEFFGLGYKYKKAEIQLATFGNVFDFNLWNVSCQYSF